MLYQSFASHRYLTWNKSITYSQSAHRFHRLLFASSLTQSTNLRSRVKMLFISITHFINIHDNFQWHERIFQCFTHLVVRIFHLKLIHCLQGYRLLFGYLKLFALLCPPLVMMMMMMILHLALVSVDVKLLFPASMSLHWGCEMNLMTLHSSCHLDNDTLMVIHSYTLLTG